MENNYVYREDTDGSEIPVCTCPSCGKFCSPETGWHVMIQDNVILFCSESCFEKYEAK